MLDGYIGNVVVMRGESHKLWPTSVHFGIFLMGRLSSAWVCDKEVNCLLYHVITFYRLLIMDSSGFELSRLMSCG